MGRNGDREVIGSGLGEKEIRGRGMAKHSRMAECGD